ncbi:efflux RND transporter periplasmic adaptor subunit [Alphaproteobacteria bacterium GH1-50]|uniref:Efflux RND transporter periplasmic adaptor subunit n=1 Tax=Kangsaoukella pontilimi TaxID=2691042 RepID=A0A7C9MUM1_9RHOB|nr:efflux RND transporter periplasmic adaptor subunit [Kangsaoukella pontilimi]MXQ07000.1 efflux RND transporter periplasmic adaptor subunit [Kangsaoukella pontilimi]
MRFFPILTAVVVVAVLYFLVFERDRLLEFAGAPAEETVIPAETDAPEDVTVAEEDDGGTRVAVVAMRSEAQTVDGAVILRGRTEAERKVDVRAETSGQIISEPRRKGSFVEAGEVLCRLDPGTREAALTEAESRRTQAEAALREAEINNTAASRLSEDGFASETRVAGAEAAVEAARAAVQSADAAIASARNELENLEIVAPFGGVLESDTAELGELLQPGSLCATVYQLDPIRLVGFVPEAMVDRVELGALAGARLTSGREIVGRVTFISRSADENTRTFRVDIEVPNSDLSIRDGQTAEIVIQSDGEVAHLLPQSALTLNDEGTLGVRVVADARAAFQPVSVLRDTIDGIWVSGLNETAEVIVVGQEFVTEGVPLTVTYREDQQ